jgi:hypothetical protein
MRHAAAKRRAVFRRTMSRYEERSMSTERRDSDARISPSVISSVTSESSRSTRRSPSSSAISIERM